MKPQIFALTLVALNTAELVNGADPPSVRVSPLPDHRLQLSWPGSAAGYLVEETSRLAPGAVWKPVLRSPVPEADLHILTVEPAAGNRFFRLRLGLAPCPSPPTRAPLSDLKLAEVGVIPEPGGYPWVEVRHSGRCGEMELDRLQLRNGRGEILVESLGRFGYTLAPGQQLVVVFDDPQINGTPLPDEWLGNPLNPSGYKVHWLTNATAFDAVSDTCVLLWSWFIQPERDQLIDSVKWGSYPEHANTLNAHDFPLFPGGSIGRDGLEPDHWVRYQTPTPGMENGLPAPLAYYPFDGANVPSEDSTTFVWLDLRTREISYRLQVDASPAFESPLIDLVIHGATHDLRPALPVGQYHWRVRSEHASAVSAWSFANRSRSPGTYSAVPPAVRSTRPAASATASTSRGRTSSEPSNGRSAGTISFGPTRSHL